jgi:hypothetical protein
MRRLVLAGFDRAALGWLGRTQLVTVALPGAIVFDWLH